MLAGLPVLPSRWLRSVSSVPDSVEEPDPAGRSAIDDERGVLRVRDPSVGDSKHRRRVVAGPQTMPRKVFPCALKTKVWAAGPLPDDHVPAMPSAASSGAPPATRATNATDGESKRFMASPFR